MNTQVLNSAYLLQLMPILCIVVILNNVYIGNCQQNNSSSNQWSGNPFNERSFIVYRPQTQVVENKGQEKSGMCPITRSAPGFKSFKQYEGLWFKRWRTRVRIDEPFFKCSYIHYIFDGISNIFIMDNLQNNATNEWKRQNATSVLYPNTPSSWTSTLQNGATFDTHLLYFDGDLGISLLYSCANTRNGHSGIGNIYTRSPDTPLSKTMINHLYDVYFQNGIYDILPLHEVKHEDCAPVRSRNQEVNDHGQNGLKRVNDLGHKNIYND